ncbi:MAG: hypothetical protein M9945_14405 [Aquamicrobium sp.]|uniref:hypothetical protein n=1 Tax=Aquamicrobium sp. TaxID=1872579 RepID=UPI00349EA03F|nr:hypothetical protein [Aquamicrobium sp.]
MSEPILFKDPEREIVLEKYRDNPTMTQILNHAFRVQDQVNHDVLEWRQPSEGKVAEVIAWLLDRRPQLTRPHPLGYDCRPTPFDYRRHARAYAVQLLFKVADPYWRSLDLISSATLEDRWSAEERIDYWRAVAICSSTWEETP